MNKAHDDDPDETEGRKLYRQQAEVLTSAQAAMASRRVKLAKDSANILKDHGAAVATVHELLDALERSVKLQSHYARLLNMHDGGERLTFDSADAWLQRLQTITSAE